MEDDKPMDAEYKELLPLLLRIESDVKRAPLTHQERAALMTMCAATLMSTAAAMMAANADAEAGRPQQKDPDVVPWLEATASTIVEMVRRARLH
jgi:hypothetical protein